MRLPASPPAVRAQEFDVGGSSFAPPPPGATSPAAQQLITRVRMGHVLRHSEMVMLRAARLEGDSRTADAQRVYLSQLRSARGPLGGNFQHALKGYSPQHAVAETRAALRAGSPLLAHRLADARRRRRRQPGGAPPRRRLGARAPAGDGARPLLGTALVVGARNRGGDPFV